MKSNKNAHENNYIYTLKKNPDSLNLSNLLFMLTFFSVCICVFTSVCVSRMSPNSFIGPTAIWLRASVFLTHDTHTGPIPYNKGLPQELHTAFNFILPDHRLHLVADPVLNSSRSAFSFPLTHYSSTTHLMKMILTLEGALLIMEEAFWWERPYRIWPLICKERLNTTDGLNRQR